MKNSYSLFRRRSLKTIVIVLGSMSAAFMVGIQTAGDVRPVVGSISADGTVIEGDFNGNGQLDIADARIALVLAHGDRTPSPSELAADPNGDFHITLEDAEAILERLERTPGTPRVEL